MSAAETGCSAGHPGAASYFLGSVFFGVRPDYLFHFIIIEAKFFFDFALK